MRPVIGLTTLFDDDKPLLGICRGIQFINAYLGGMLYQDLPTEYNSKIEHHMMPPYDRAAHKILEDIHTVDRARKKYCKHYTNTEFGNVDYYDLCVKSSALGIDKCIDIISDAANS